jgi:hypothetical protein
MNGLLVFGHLGPFGRAAAHLQPWQGRTRWSSNERIGSIGPADYSKAMKRDDIVVNRQYQVATQYGLGLLARILMETVLKGFPHFQALPGPNLYQVTGLRSRQTIKEIFECILLNVSHLDTVIPLYRSAQPAVISRIPLTNPTATSRPLPLNYHPPTPPAPYPPTPPPSPMIGGFAPKIMIRVRSHTPHHRMTLT